MLLPALLPRHPKLQFVDSTMDGLLSWRAESDVLLAELREQVFFTQRKKVGGSRWVPCGAHSARRWVGV